MEVTYRSLVTYDVAHRLLAEHTQDAVLVVVGDRVTETARRLLTASNAGYYDLRGRLALRTHSLVIDTETDPITQRAGRTNALSGRAGLEVATAMLMHPERPVAVRRLARALARAPSTVSEVLTALRREGLTDPTNLVTHPPDLFWAVAERWGGQRTLLAKAPLSGDATLAGPLHLGLGDVDQETGWALTDSAAAAAYGAPVAFRSGQVLHFYVPYESTVRRATTLLGSTTTASQARATIRVAPVPAVVRRRVQAPTHAVEWPLAHPLFVALDLAQDVSRGREILDAWTPDVQWTRVW